MASTKLTGRRWASAAVLGVGGAVVALAAWIGGDHGLALGLLIFYVLAAVAVYVWSGRDGDVAAIMRAGGDERQRRLDRDAIAVAGVAMAAVAVVGVLVAAATNEGDAGGYGVVCVVGAATYVVSLFVLRRRG